MDKIIFVKDLNGAIRTPTWDEYREAFAEHTRKNLFQKTEAEMEKHYVIQPKKYRRQYDDSWKEE